MTMNNRFNPKKPISIYGFGGFGKQIASELKKNGIPVKYFIDQKAKKGMFVDGIECINTHEITSDVEQVVIGIFNRDLSPKKIEKILVEKKIKTIIGFGELSNYFPEFRISSFWYDSALDVKDFGSKSEKIIKLLFDQRSRVIFQDLLKYRGSGMISDHLDGMGLDSQYFSPEIENWIKPSTKTCFVDCGAYIGDSLALALYHKFEIETAYCFEPDLKNFLKLNEFIKKFKGIQAHLIPCGTYSQTKRLSFNESGTEGSCLSENSQNLIQVISLDDYFYNIKFNFLKIDVEGMDLDTLRGAMQTILLNRPYIAVSIYHRPGDLWDIPIFLYEKLEKYQFHLRQHGHNGMDTIFYCIPID